MLGRHVFLWVELWRFQQRRRRPEAGTARIDPWPGQRRRPERGESAAAGAGGSDGESAGENPRRPASTERSTDEASVPEMRTSLAGHCPLESAPDRGGNGLLGPVTGQEMYPDSNRYRLFKSK